MLHCQKCNGTGYLESFSHIKNGKCFQCNGSGIHYHVIGNNSGSCFDDNFEEGAIVVKGSIGNETLGVITKLSHDKKEIIVKWYIDWNKFTNETLKAPSLGISILLKSSDAIFDKEYHLHDLVAFGETHQIEQDIEFGEIFRNSEIYEIIGISPNRREIKVVKVRSYFMDEGEKSVPLLWHLGRYNCLPIILQMNKEEYHEGYRRMTSYDDAVLENESAEDFYGDYDDDY